MSDAPIKIAFLGQKPIAELVLTDLLKAIDNDAPLEVAFICTNMISQGWWGSASLVPIAQKRKIQVIDNTSNDANLLKSQIAHHAVNLIVSIQHPHILEDYLIEQVAGRAFNLHLAPLPRFRGWNAASHAIIEQFDEFGVTLHTMNSRVDAGLIIEKQDFLIPRDATAWSLYQESVQIGRTVMSQFFKKVVQPGLDNLQGLPMEGESRYYSRHSLDSLRDITGRTFDEIQRIWRATFYPPFPPAYFNTPYGTVELVLRDRDSTK